MDLFNQIGNFFSQINWVTITKVSVQIFVICYGVLWLWRRIAGTHAERLVKGMMVLIIIALIAWTLELTIIVSILQHIIPVAAMALVIIFQPEMRRGLGYLGRMQGFKVDLSLTHTNQEKNAAIIKEIIKACRELSRTRTGALIVIEPPEGERDYVSPGTAVNADISSTMLLLSSFPSRPCMTAPW